VSISGIEHKPIILQQHFKNKQLVLNPDFAAKPLIFYQGETAKKITVLFLRHSLKESILFVSSLSSIFTEK